MLQRVTPHLHWCSELNMYSGARHCRKTEALGLKSEELRWCVAADDRDILGFEEQT